MEPRRGSDEDVRALEVAVVSISYQIASASLESSGLYEILPFTELEFMASRVNPAI